MSSSARDNAYIGKVLKKQRKNRFTTIMFTAYAIITVLLLACYSALGIWTHHRNEDLQIYHIVELGVDHSEEKVTGSITKNSEWSETDSTLSIKYDGVIENHNNYEITDWSIQIPARSYTTISDYWNGYMSFDGSVLTFTPNSEIISIPAESSRTFGFILNMPIVNYVTDATMSCHAQHKMEDNVWYWILGITSLITIVGLVVNLFWRSREKRFKEQLDAEQEILSQAVKTFVNFMDAKDSYTRGHSARVAQYALEIGRRMGKSEEELDRLYIIALMHDVGKMSIPDQVLNKPGKLTEEEFATIKTHTTRAESILSSFTAIEQVSDGAKYHHERYDGMGYPEGRAGKDIPECARIICIADAYDAMSTDRCYRSKLQTDEIISELKRCAGSQFDPDIVPVMIDYLEDFAL